MEAANDIEIRRVKRMLVQRRQMHLEHVQKNAPM
jgi:hypothetical protein